VFWKQLGFLPAASIVAQRTLWSLLLLLPLVWFRRERAELVAGLKRPAAFGWHALSGALLASNWLLYVWATLHGHIVEGALGYYLNPFFNMLFGALWFGERHNRLQLAAIGLALAGLGFQIPAVSGFPWISVALAVTFALYAVVRKKAPLGALSGLVVETVLLSPVALVWLIGHSASLPAAFGGTPECRRLCPDVPQLHKSVVDERVVHDMNGHALILGSLGSVGPIGSFGSWVHWVRKRLVRRMRT